MHPNPDSSPVVFFDLPAARPAERFIRLPEVMRRVGLARTAIYAGVKAGTFPAPIKNGAASAWLETEVTAWMAARVEESRRGAKKV